LKSVDKKKMAQSTSKGYPRLVMEMEEVEERG